MVGSLKTRQEAIDWALWHEQKMRKQGTVTTTELQNYNAFIDLYTKLATVLPEEERSTSLGWI